MSTPQSSGSSKSGSKLFLIILLVVLVAGGGTAAYIFKDDLFGNNKEEEAAAKAENARKNKAVEVKGHKNYLIGTWKGNLAGKSFKLVLERLEGNQVVGYRVKGTTVRPVKGPFEDVGNYYTLNIKEPGDESRDGVYRITLNKSTLKLTGEWVQNGRTAKWEVRLSPSK